MFVPTLAMRELAQFAEFLRWRLQQPLPGEVAHRMMAPAEEGRDRPLRPLPGSYPSAVLVLLVELKAAPAVVLTLRSAQLRRHRGELSFPGGMSLPGEPPIVTALREGQEEIGVAPEQVEVLGVLTPVYVPSSHAAMVPVLGMLRWGTFVPNCEEVEQVVPVQLELLRQGERLRVGFWERDGRRLRVPYWAIDAPVPLWGATAMVLSELLVLYEEFLRDAGRW